MKKNWKNFPRTAMGMAILSVVLTPVWADDDGTAMQSVLVSASRNETPLEKMPTSTTVITREEIEKSSAQSVDQLLKTIPGFNFSGAPSYSSDPTGTQTKMRGLGNDKVLVLLDGIPIIDPFYETTQWFRVPMTSIERIEIVRSGGSSLWGSMAVGGVINIITKTPKNGSGDVSISAGSFGTSNMSFTKNVVMSDALQFTFSGNRYQTNGYQTTPSQYLYAYPGKQAPTDTNQAVQMAAFFRPSSDVKGFLRIGTYSQNQDLYGVYGQNLQQSPNISAGLTKLLDDNSSLDSKLWAQNVVFNKMNGAGCDISTGGSPVCGSSITTSTPTSSVLNIYTQQGYQFYTERGASSVYSKNLEGIWNSVQAGVDFRQLSVNDQETYYKSSPTTLATPEVQSAVASGTGIQTFTGVFSQLKFTPAKGLTITTSGRFDNWSNTNRDLSINGTGGASPDLVKTQFDPSVGFHYDLDESSAFRGSVFKAFRAPGLNNQIRSYGAVGSMNIANPNLIPESVNGLELGWDFKTEKSKTSLTYFSDQISNMIATSSVNGSNEPAQVASLCGTLSSSNTSCGSSVNYYTNNQNGQSNGIELTHKWMYSDRLTFDGFVTYTNTYLTSAWNGVTTPLNTQLAGIPHITASLSATWKMDAKTQLFVQSYYIGPLNDSSSLSSSTVGNIQGGNNIINGSVIYAMDKSTDVYLNATNLFNLAYQDSTYSSLSAQTLAPPRTLNVGLRYRF